MVNPAIIITGSVSDETSAEIVERGACDCLPKPFNPEQLRIAISKALSISVQPSSAVRNAG